MLEGRDIDKKTEMIVAPGSKQASEILARRGLGRRNDGRRRQLLGGDVWCLYRHRSRSRLRLRLSADVQPQLRGSLRYRGRQRLSLLAGSRHRGGLKGEIVDPRDLADELGDLEAPGLEMPDQYIGNSESDLIAPDNAVDDELIKGPNIGDVPMGAARSGIQGEALLKMDDNITTDHIIPATSDILMYRSNVEKLSEFTLSRVDDTFAERALEADGGVLVAGENYGQGSSREHAAMCPSTSVSRPCWHSVRPHPQGEPVQLRYLPLAIDEETYEKIEEGDDIEVVDDAAEAVKSGQTEFTIRVNDDWEATASLTPPSANAYPRRGWQTLAHEAAARRRRRCTC